MKRKCTAALVLAVLFGISLTGLFLPDRLFSLREKRKLRQFPEMSAQALADGSFARDFERWSLDQFPGRDGWITGKSVWDALLGKRERRGVYLGSGGCLLERFPDYDLQQLDKNIRALEDLSRLTEKAQIPLSVLLVPTAAAVSPEALPFCAPSADQTEIYDRLLARGLPVVDVLPTLRAHREEYLYYRTDHHFTSLGAWYCCQAWRQQTGRPLEDPALYTKEPLCQNFRGTTWAKYSLPWIVPDEITAWYCHPNHPVEHNRTEQADSLYQRDRLETDPYAVFCGGNQALTVIQGSGTSGKLLMVRDSFGSTFAQFPAEDFREVHMIDLRFFRENVGDYIREQGITEVLVIYGLQNFVGDTFLHF